MHFRAFWQCTAGWYRECYGSPQQTDCLVLLCALSLNDKIYNIPERLAFCISDDQKNKNSHLHANCVKSIFVKIYIMISCKIDGKELNKMIQESPKMSYWIYIIQIEESLKSRDLKHSGTCHRFTHVIDEYCNSSQFLHWKHHLFSIHESCMNKNSTMSDGWQQVFIRESLRGIVNAVII